MKTLDLGGLVAKMIEEQNHEAAHADCGTSFPLLEAQHDTLQAFLDITKRFIAGEHVRVGDYVTQNNWGKRVYKCPAHDKEGKQKQLAVVTGIYDGVRISDRGHIVNGEITVVECSHGTVAPYPVDLRYYEKIETPTFEGEEQ